MKRIHKGSFYRYKTKGEVVVISTQDIERTNASNYLFEAVVLIDTLNPERVGSTTVCHAYNVAKTDLEISIKKP